MSVHGGADTPRALDRPAVVTIGNFDGVHMGHRFLLRQVADRARVLGVGSYAVTFEPDPQAVLYPDRRPPRLTDPDEKVCLMRSAGVEAVWVCPFTRELSLLSPSEFMALVARRQRIAELWIGADFALGRNRSGTIAVLAEIGGLEGWALHMVPPLRQEGRVVSSTAIRALLAAGDVEEAALLLGRSYAASARLERQGAAWIARLDPERALPPPAAYAAWMRLGAQRVPVLASVLPSDGDERRASLRWLDDAPTDLAEGDSASLLLAGRLRALQPGEASHTDAAGYPRLDAADAHAARAALARTPALEGDAAC